MPSGFCHSVNGICALLGFLHSIEWQFLTDILGMIGCSETLIRMYYSVLCKILIEHRS